MKKINNVFLIVIDLFLLVIATVASVNGNKYFLLLIFIFFIFSVIIGVINNDKKK